MAAVAKNNKKEDESSPIVNLIKNWGPTAVMAVVQLLTGGGTAEIKSLVTDKKLLDDLVKIDFSKTYKNMPNFIKRRNKNHNVVKKLDTAKCNRCENMKVLEQQKDALDCKLVDYEKQINSLCKSYLTMGSVFLILSWIDIALTLNAISNASKEIKQYTEQIEEVRNKYINPVLKYHQNVIEGKRIKNWSKYHSNLTKLYTALDFLKLYKQQAVNMKSSMGQLSVKSGSNAVGQAISAYQTSTVLKCAANASPLLKLGVSALMGAQILTACTYAGQAVKCYVLWQELGDVVNKLDEQIKGAEKMIKDLRSIQLPKPMKDFVDDNDDDEKLYDFAQYKQGVWNVDDVVNWIRGLGQSFESIAPIFKDNDINGPDLLSLDDEQLEAMGINKLKRKQLLKKIQQLKNT